MEGDEEGKDFLLSWVMAAIMMLQTMAIHQPRCRAAGGKITSHCNGEGVLSTLRCFPSIYPISSQQEQRGSSFDGCVSTDQRQWPVCGL